MPRRSRGTHGGLAAAIAGLVAAIGFTRDNAGEWFRGLLVALVLALVVRWAVAEPYRIPSGSMEPTLHGDPGLLRGDRVFINKWMYGLRVPFSNTRIWRGREPKRFDIVVFRAAEPNAEFPTLIKRVIGLPGERVHIEDGKVFVDGEALRLPDSMPHVDYTRAGEYGVRDEDEFAVVPAGHYFLLGDNSASSRDGRIFGWVPHENLRGRAFGIIWPVTRWRDFTGFTQRWWWRAPIALIVVFAVVRLFLGRSWRVRNSSIGDPVHDGEHVYINRVAFGIPVPFTRHRATRGREPRRGECALYIHPKHDTGPVLGRIAGLPGDPFTGRDGKPTLVPAGRYLIARDGHIAHAVRREDLIGSVAVVWWPPARWRRVRS
jgi:signal peptidase I